MALLFFIAGLWKQFRKDKTSGLTACYLTVFGVMLFLCFWETTARYTINTLPLILLGAADGIAYLEGAIPKRIKWETKTQE